MAERKPTDPSDGAEGFLKGIEDLWEKSVEQLGGLREALVRTSQTGRARVDALLLKREREQLLAQLGRAVEAEVIAGRMQVPVIADDVWRRLKENERKLESVLEAAETSEPEQPAEAPPAGTKPAAAKSEPSTTTEPPRGRRTAPAEPGTKTIGRRRPPVKKNRPPQRSDEEKE